MNGFEAYGRDDGPWTMDHGPLTIDETMDHGRGTMVYRLWSTIVNYSHRHNPEAVLFS